MIAICLTLAILMLIFVLFTVLNRLVVYGASKADITKCAEEDSIDKKYEAIVVLGAGVRPDGTPSHMLEDRLKGAVALYKKGVAKAVVLSGDNSGEDYDEVSAMERYCLTAGIPKEAIIRDDIGFSTYETMYNAIVASGYRRIIVVTQEYHLYRAVYTGIRMGAEVDGYASDYRTYRGQSLRDIREYFARVKDFFAVNLSLR